jgi:hypothetical protein
MQEPSTQAIQALPEQNPLAALRTKVGNAQIVTFAKSWFTDRPVGPGRPITDLHPAFTMLRSKPTYRPFAARAKSGDGRTHSVRDMPDLWRIQSNVSLLRIYSPLSTTHGFRAEIAGEKLAVSACATRLSDSTAFPRSLISTRNSGSINRMTFY